MPYTVILNTPYIAYLIRAENKIDDLKSRLFYKGNNRDAFVNHAINIISAGCVYPSLSIKNNLLINTTFIGLQTFMYPFFNVHGVSLIWSGLTGILLGEMFLKKFYKKPRIIIPIILNMSTLIYYAYNEDISTTITHLAGMTTGFIISIPLFT